MSLKKGDLLVVSAVFLIALALLDIRALPAAAGNRVLRIELDGEMLQEIPLDEQNSEMVTIPIPNGEAVVEIDKGRVRMLPMTEELCPQGICSHVGWVQRSGDAIVCLPNRLVLTVVGGQTEEILDGVTQ